MTEATAPFSALDIRRAQNKRKAIELGKAGLDPYAIAQQIRMPLFVARRILTVAGIPLLPRAVAPITTPDPPPVPIALERRRPGRQRKAKAAPSDPAFPRRGPGRPRKVPRSVDLPISLDPSQDPELELVRSRFTEFRTMTAISIALKIPGIKVRKALYGLPPERFEAWKDLNRMRREVEQLVVRRRKAKR